MLKFTNQDIFINIRHFLPKLATLICCLILLLSAPLFAQTAIKGIYLIDDKSKIPVAESFVQSEDLKFKATADENGFVNIIGLSTFTGKLIISRIGYETKIVDMLSLKKGDDITAAIIYLNTTISSLKEITVRSYANSSSGGVFKTISDLDIHLRPINNSQEVLRMVPGLFIGQHAGGGKSEQIFLRGFDIDHGTDINLSVDGMPVNMVSHAHGQGYADLHFLIPEIIEKVNFNKGPYFADKGNFTTAGFVDFKTKNYLENNFVKIEGGQFNTFRGITGLNLLKQKGDKRNQSLYFASEASFTKGFFESPQNFNRLNGMLKYHGSLGTNSVLTALVSGFTSKWNASGQIPDRAVESGKIGFYGAIDNTEGGQTSRYNANIELVNNFDNGGVLRNRIYYTHYKFKLYSNFTFFKEDPINGDQIRQGEDRNLVGYTGSYQKDFLLGNIKTQINTGVQVRYDLVDNLELSRTKNRNITTMPIMFGKVNELSTAAFWAQKFSLSNQLDISAGLRADYFSNRYNDKLNSQQLSSDAALVSPKLNFNYRVNDRVELYWYNGRGFHSNDTRVAVQQNGKKVVPPGWATDIGGVFKPAKKLVLQAALWYLQLDQEFIYVGDEGVVEPSGKSRRVGIDVSMRYEVANHLFADLDVSIANPRAVGVAKTDSYLPLAPRFTSVGGLNYRKEYGWNGSLRYRFMNKRPANENYTVTAKGYLIVDAAVNYSTKRWEAGLSIQNILNTKWKETQFDTESRLQNEPAPVSEIHFTPGSPFFARLNLTVFF